MGRPHTTIGAERFHFRVRKGIGWFPLAIAARQTFIAFSNLKNSDVKKVSHAVAYTHQSALVLYGQAARAISTGWLHSLLNFHTQPINLVVFEGSSGTSRVQGNLILKGASRLDAFSGYPVRI